jgi:hypothetical protein
MDLVLKLKIACQCTSRVSNMISIPREIVTEICAFLDVCFFRSLCMSNKYLYESYEQTNRKTVSFADVPSVFNQRVRNYQCFCSNATSLDVSGTPISTRELVVVVVIAPHLVLVTALECPNIKSGKLFVTLARKKNKRQLQEIKNRKTHIELSMPESGTIHESFYELFSGMLTSNVFGKPHLIACKSCRALCHWRDLTVLGYVIRDHHYVDSCCHCSRF